MEYSVLLHIGNFPWLSTRPHKGIKVNVLYSVGTICIHAMLSLYVRYFGFKGEFAQVMIRHLISRAISIDVGRMTSYLI